MAIDGNTESNNASLITEDVVQNIIAELVAEAPSPEVKSCLKAYEFGKNVRQLKSAFNVFNKPVLESTLNYLNVPGQNEYLKAANVDNVICRIQNLLPDTCGMCNKEYCVKNNDCMLLSCAFCGQEVHHECLQKFSISSALENGESLVKLEELSKNDVMAKINPFSLPALMYSCKACTDSRVPSSESGLKKKSARKNHMHSEKHSTVPPPDGSQMQMNGTTDVARDDSKTVDDPGANKKSTRDEIPICKFFLHKKCKFGIKGDECKYSHPPLCKKLLKYGHSKKGCNKGKHCDEGIHPKMCHHSLNGRECPYESCRYYHVSGTKKVRKNENFIQDHQPEPNLQPNFLDAQARVFQSLKAEILEAMDIRLGTILSQMHMPQPKIRQYVNPQYSGQQGHFQSPGKMINVSSPDQTQVHLNQSYPNQLTQEWNSGPQETMKSSPVNFQTHNNMTHGYQQMVPSPVV